MGCLGRLGIYLATLAFLMGLAIFLRLLPLPYRIVRLADTAVFWTAVLGLLTAALWPRRARR